MVDYIYEINSPQGVRPMSDLASIEARLDRLESLEQIRQLPARYGLALDMRDMDALAGLFVEDVRVDLIGYLFGDILAVGRADLAWIWGGAVAGLALLAFLWRPLLSVTVHADLAAVEGVNVGAMRLAFVLLLAVLVAVAMKIVGVLLVTALLVMPAAAARRFARSPESMAAIASGIGAFASVAGLLASVEFDTPSGPSVVVAAASVFAFSLVLPQRR
jgi:zinc transport system permease protein